MCHFTLNLYAITLDPMHPFFSLGMQNTIHPVFNITMDKVQLAHSYFSKLSVPVLIKATGEEAPAAEDR